MRLVNIIEAVAEHQHYNGWGSGIDLYNKRVN